mmetsp:Transcript_118143/g.294645  ORF Transcript_118143/g.294645 Transcript_118143/m.294645 type:complete len:292 (+) Transcript_118143:259-1134(+)
MTLAPLSTAALADHASARRTLRCAQRRFPAAGRSWHETRLPLLVHRSASLLGLCLRGGRLAIGGSGGRLAVGGPIGGAVGFALVRSFGVAVLPSCRVAAPSPAETTAAEAAKDALQHTEDSSEEEEEDLQQRVQDKAHVDDKEHQIAQGLRDQTIERGQLGLQLGDGADSHLVRRIVGLLCVLGHQGPQLHALRLRVGERLHHLWRDLGHLLGDRLLDIIHGELRHQTVNVCLGPSKGVDIVDQVVGAVEHLCRDQGFGRTSHRTRRSGQAEHGQHGKLRHRALPGLQNRG